MVRTRRASPSSCQTILCNLRNVHRTHPHTHTGGRRQFHLFEQELGDTLVSNGKIALLIFGRVADVQRGVLKLAETGVPLCHAIYPPIALPAHTRRKPDTHQPARMHHFPGRVSSGINLVFSRFHNKGVVGVALQYHGTAIAFLVAHYASDSGGRKRWERRDEVRVRASMGPVRCLYRSLSNRSLIGPYHHRLIDP